MSDSWSDEHISAWLDDELSPAEREAFERHLNENPRDAERVQEFQSLREKLRTLPRLELDEGFAGRVVEAIERTAATPALAAAADVASVESPVKPTRRASFSRPATLNWQVAGATISGLAALLLLAMFLAPRPTNMMGDNRATEREKTAKSGVTTGGESGPGVEKQMNLDSSNSRAGGIEEKTEDESSGRRDQAGMPAPRARAPDADIVDPSTIEAYSDDSRDATTSEMPADDKNSEMLDELEDRANPDPSELRDLKSTPDASAGAAMEKHDADSGFDAGEPGLTELKETEFQRGMANSLNQPEAATVEMGEFAGYAFDEIVVVSTQSKQLQWLEPQVAEEQTNRELEEQNDVPAPPNPGGFSMNRDNSFGADDKSGDDEKDESAGKTDPRHRRRSMNRQGSAVPQPAPVPLHDLMFVTVDATETELQAIIERMEGTPLTLGQGQLIDMMSRFEQAGGAGGAGGGGGFGGGGSGQRDMYRGRAEFEPQMRMQRMLPSERAERKLEQEQEPEKPGDMEGGDGQPDLGRGGGGRGGSMPEQGRPAAEPRGGQAPNANQGADPGTQDNDQQSAQPPNQSGQTPEIQTRRRYLLVIQRVPAETAPVPPAAQDR
ncbi:MAG: anti-sigma factor family protein [Pirellulaceae bacterium]